MKRWCKDIDHLIKKKQLIVILKSHLNEGPILKSNSLEAVCLKAMSAEPKNRYVSVERIQKKKLQNTVMAFATAAENASFLKLLQLRMSDINLLL